MSDEETGSAEASEKTSKLKTVAIWIGGFFAVGSSIAGFFADGMSAVQEISGAGDVSAEVAEFQRKTNSALEGDGDAVVPVDCMPDEEDVLKPLVAASELLRGGKAGAQRPQDADALKSLKGRVDSNPSDAVFWALYAKAHLYSGSPASEVIKNAKVALNLCDNWAFPHNLIGNAHFVGNQHDEAEAAYRSALALVPDYTAPRFNIALISLKKKGYAEAIDQLNKLIEKHPHHKNAHMLRAQANLGLNNLAEAAGDAKGEIDRQPDSASAHALYGQILHKQGDKEKAREALCKAKALGHPAGDKLCPAPEKAVQ